MSWLPSVDLLSFDVFDTLIERRLGPPDQVKRLAARHFLEANRSAVGAIDQERILRLRAKVEAALRRGSREAGLDGECRLTEIAAGMAVELALAARGSSASSLERALVESELAAETRAVVAKPGMSELLAELRQRGKRVVAVSDMYLDEWLLRELLDRVGIAVHLDAVYVSSEHGVGKHSGRLFRKMLELERTPAARVVHIGDNVRSDYQMPRSLGAGAVHFHESGHAERRDVMRTYQWLARRNAYWCGAHMLAELEPSSDEKFLFQYGYRVLGPIFSIFVARTRELMIEREVERVYFLAREGELFRRIYQLFEDPSLGFAPAPTPHYLYVSRKVVALPASYRGLSAHLLRAFSGWVEHRGFAPLASVFGMEAEAFAAVARRLGLNGTDEPVRSPPDAWLAEVLSDQDLQSKVRARAAAPRELLRAYLEQEGLFGRGRKIAICDIGWVGTVQRCLLDAFGDEPDWPHAAGYYLSFEDAYGYGLGERDAVGVLFDGRRDHFEHGTYRQFEELFENAARALHGSTVTYARAGDGRVAPVLHDATAAARQAEKSSDAITTELQRGILAFARDFVARHALYAYRATDLVPYAHEVARRAVCEPTRDEAEHVLGMVHADDTAPGGTVDLSRFRAAGPGGLLRPGQLRRLLRESSWKYGTLRTLRVPGLAPLLRGTLWLRAYGRSVARGTPRGIDARIPGPKLLERAALRIARTGIVSVGVTQRRLRKTSSQSNF